MADSRRASATPNKVIPLVAPERRHHVLEVYREMGLEFRRTHGLAGEKFDQRVTDRFEEAVVRIYWRALENYLRKTHKIHFGEIQKRLNKSRTTVWRWFKNKNEPGLENFLFLLAAFDIDVQDVNFPRGREAMNYGRAEAVWYIRREEWPREKKASSLGREKLECLHYLFTSAEWQQAQRTRDAARLSRAANEIVENVRRYVPNGMIQGADELQAIVREWFIPWILFSTVPIYNWPC